MSRRPRPQGLAVLLIGALALASCGSGDGDVIVAPPAAAQEPVASSTTTTTTTTTTTPSTPTTPSTTAPPTTAVTEPSAPSDEVADYSLFATAGIVDLFLPARRVELIGFHEAGHDGSQQQTVVEDAIPSVTLESRNRNTGSRTAADIVVAPDEEIRSPVTGTVIRGGTYVLYCDHSDDFLVIEPDSAPGWEVKIFHIDGLTVGVGDRVEAGITVIAPRATLLPFESQVDEFTAEPSNPHVHVEVVDPSIPDIPSPGGGC